MSFVRPKQPEQTTLAFLFRSFFFQFYNSKRPIDIYYLSRDSLGEWQPRIDNVQPDPLCGRRYSSVHRLIFLWPACAALVHSQSTCVYKCHTDIYSDDICKDRDIFGNPTGDIYRPSSRCRHFISEGVKGVDSFRCLIRYGWFSIDFILIFCRPGDAWWVVSILAGRKSLSSPVRPHARVEKLVSIYYYYIKSYRICWNRMCVVKLSWRWIKCGRALSCCAVDGHTQVAGRFYKCVFCIETAAWNKTTERKKRKKKRSSQSTA